MNLDECDALFDQVLSSATESELCHRVLPIFNFYDVSSIGLGRGRTIFWRARIVPDNPWLELSDLDYPPADKARAGRLNDAGCPSFYVANSVHTALCEIESEEGQLVQVAGFRVHPKEMVRLIVVGEYANVYKSGYLHITGIDPEGTMRKLLNAKGKKAISTIYADKFLAGIINDPKARDSNYKFSRALGAILHSRVTADGIAFPSVRDPGGYNCAVKPEPSDRTFQNVACALVRVGKRRRFNVLEHEVVTSALGLDDDGRFVWPSSGEAARVNIYGATQEEYMAVLASADDPGAVPRALSHEA